MRSLYETCEPRAEVLSGELREELFAARLKDVVDGTADPVYGDPEQFFDNTYPTEGLRTLLREALGRLTGRNPSANAVIRLETPFGGGKTHNLIALYHAARGSPAAARLVDRELLPASGTVRIAGIVGSDLDPTGGVLHPDVTTYTVWGELAYQLGGVAGYRLVEESDRRTKAAPGTGVLDQLVGDQPVLILLDEVARYLRAARAVPTLTGESNLAGQTIAFLMSLLEFAASRQQVVVVLTLADSGDAFGKESEELREQLAEARRISARSERVLTPAGEDETPSIVTHRLFRRVDRAAARETAEGYLAALRAAAERGAPLPHEVTTAAYAERILKTYPFHPELLRVLSVRLSTIPNFQRTRGALRLLALVVRRLWERHAQPLYLIHPHHVDLAFEPIVEDLTSRLDRPSFKQVIEADIVSRTTGHRAHAQEIDTRFVEAGRPPYAQRLATTIFLHSLVQGHGAGVDEAMLTAATLEPGDEPAVFQDVLQQLEERCWYLAEEHGRLRFGTEVQLPKVIADEMALVPTSLAKEMLRERIRQVWTRGALEPVYFPDEPAAVPDDAGTPKLVIVHFDAAATTSAQSEPPALVRKLFEEAGATSAFRRFRNNLVFLVCDQEQRNELVDRARRYLAIERLVSPDRLQDFSETQRRKLRDYRDQAELELRVAITRAYRFLFYPSSDASAEGGVQLARETLPAQDQGTVSKAQTDVIVQALRRLDKVRSGDDASLAPEYVRARAWSGQQGMVSTEDIRRAFAQRVGLPILLDLNLLKRTIREGIASGTWVYYDAAQQLGYDKESGTVPHIEISDDTYLYTPEEAARAGIRLARPAAATPPPPPPPPSPQQCPVCGNPTDACTCGSEDTQLLEAEGVAPVAFQQLYDHARERGVGRIGHLTLRWEGSGRAAAQELRVLSLIPSQVPGGQARIDFESTAEFGDGEALVVRFAGNAERWSPVRQLVESLSGQATRWRSSVTVRLDFGAEGLQLDPDLVNLQKFVEGVPLGKVQIRAEEATESRKETV